MKLIIDGNISRTYVQNLCLLFFQGMKFSEQEEVTPDTPVLHVKVTENADSVSASAHLQLGQIVNKIQKDQNPTATSGVQGAKAGYCE